MISSSFETHRNARIHTHAHKHACSHVSTRARVCPIASSKQENAKLKLKIIIIINCKPIKLQTHRHKINAMQ